MSDRRSRPDDQPSGPDADSFGGVTITPAPCPVCGATIAFNSGGCVKCLLGTALTHDEGTDETESLDAVLNEVDLPDGDWQLGNYQILGEIGRGGMGVIYRARQRHSKRIVALKRVLSYHSDSRETLERFRREAEAAASLDHPNILPIYEVAEADGLPFFTMKLASGGSLQRAAAGLSADPRECVRLLAKVARAVAYAHEQGILHRDLKPGNILLDGNGEPLVSDFGLAKWIEAKTDLTRSLAIFGTPGFIAPEQAHGPAAGLSAASDIYSLGAILFDLLTGRPPFLGEHAISVINQAADHSAPKLRSINASLDRDLETICAKCLEREPKARYRSASDLAEDLERWLAGRAIIARPVSAAENAWRWARRNPALAATASLLLLAGGFALARQLEGWQLQKQIDERISTQHSVQVLPLLELETAMPSTPAAAELAAALEESFSAMGPAKLTVASEPLALAGSPNAPAQRNHSARALLSGTTRRIGDQTRVSLYLLEANSRAPVLHEVIEADSAAAFASAAAQAARRMYATLSQPELPNLADSTADPGLLDPEARSFIAQGTELANKRGGLDLERSIACFRYAIERQPESAAAHAALAKALAFQSGYRSSKEPLAVGLEHARRAVALDSSSAEAHLALAALLSQEGKINQSNEATHTSLEYSPVTRRAAYLLANNYKAIGRPDKALAWRNVAVRNGEATAARDAGTADCFSYVGDDGRAESIYEHERRLHPEQPEGWVGVCRLRLLNGRFEEARAIYQSEIKGYSDFAFASQIAAQVEFFARNFPEAEKLYKRLYEHERAGGIAFYGAVSYASALGRLWLETDPAKARELLEHARAAERDAVASGSEHPGTRYRLAAIEASLGNKAAALAELDAAAEIGWLDHRSLSIDPRFDNLHGEPAFAAIIERIAARSDSLRAAVSDAVDGHEIKGATNR